MSQTHGRLNPSQIMELSPPLRSPNQHVPKLVESFSILSKEDGSMDTKCPAHQRSKGSSDTHTDRQTDTEMKHALGEHLLAGSRKSCQGLQTAVEGRTMEFSPEEPIGFCTQSL